MCFELSPRCSSYWSHDGFDVLDEPDTEFGLPGGGYNAPTNRRGGPTTSQYGCEYSSQKFVYEGLGRGVLNNALNGFVSSMPSSNRRAVGLSAHSVASALPCAVCTRSTIVSCCCPCGARPRHQNCCLFAYGQTGSGKSYSFVGYGTNKGIVPQVCDEIFKRKTEIEASGTTTLQVTFSMMEIYNEKIRDLLNPDPKTNNDLKVRTTPKGTFVEGSKAKAVGSFDAINREMENGTASRTVAATQMNATSSRAHTIMAITVKQIIQEDGRTKEIASDMNLVDLAVHSHPTDLRVGGTAPRRRFSACARPPLRAARHSFLVCCPNAFRSPPRCCLVASSCTMPTFSPRGSPFQWLATSPRRLFSCATGFRACRVHWSHRRSTQGGRRDQ